MEVGNAVVDAVDGTLKRARVLQCAAARTENRVNAAERVPREVRIANRAEALTDKTVVEIVDQRGGNNSGVAGDEAFVVVHDVGDWRLARQERSIGLILIGEPTAESQALLAIARDVVIDLGDVPVLGVSRGGGETIT